MILFLIIGLIFLCHAELRNEILPQYAFTESSTCALLVQGESEGGYYVTVGIGSPVQYLNLLIDTGSSNVAVSVSPDPINFTYFHYNNSKSFQRRNEDVSIRYTEGEWQGFLASDVITLVSADNMDCVSGRVDIACITTSKNIFAKYTAWQGVMGLGFKAIAKPENVKPFFDSFTEIHNISNIFSLSLCGPYLTSEKLQTTAGKFVLGDSDSELHKDNIVYTPIVRKWYYEVIITNMKVNNKSVPLPCTEINNDKTIVDSGTSYLSLPEKVFLWLTSEIRTIVEKHLASVFTDDFWMGKSVGCIENINDLSAFPSVTLELLHSKETAFSLVISPHLYLQRVPTLPFKKLCFKLACSISKTGTVIGASILKGFDVVFDRDGSCVGFSNSTCKTESFSAGAVLKPYYKKGDLFDCLYREETTKSLKIFAYVIGFISVICAIPILTMLLRWIWRHLILREPLSSENSSLVGDD